MSTKIRMEACVESVEGVLAAQAGGADRIELCANLAEGGTTPSAGTLEQARKQATVDLNVMLRPRGGDFLYSELEYAVMLRDLEVAKGAGVAGVVVGMLSADGRIDLERTREFVRAARPLSVTFHRAFDMARDPFEALEDLASLGVERILSSGQQQSAWEGLELLSALVARARGRISVMPGGGITASNIKTILERSRATEVHVHPRVNCESGMQFRNPRCLFRSASGRSEFQRLETSRERMRAFVDAAQGTS